ncbi:MAG: hypothetical protein GTO17_12020 [Candidatus Aminicenantes bacterium]|nr:hypothetical protein [Candidatus Aminicenantes bacterium]
MNKPKVSFLAFMMMCLAYLFVGSLETDQRGAQDEIDRINSEIQLQGLEWKAGVTSLTYATPEERRKRLGALVPLHEDPSKFVHLEEKAALPDYWDWSDRNGRNYMTSIKNQGSCGSCWAFSANGVAEAVYNIEKGLYSIQTSPSNDGAYPVESLLESDDHYSDIRALALDYPDLSEQELVSCSWAGTCDGGYASRSFDYIKSNGVVPEDCFPYEESDVPCNRCSDWRNKLTRIQGWGYVTQSSVNKNAIKAALLDGPCSFYMDVYSDFYNYDGGIYEKTPSATYEGGHLVVLVGYDESQDCWICKNSWGRGWGENGYFRIRRGECEGGTWISKAWGVSISNRAPNLSPIENQIVKEGEQLTFQVMASDPDGDILTYSASSLPNGAILDSLTGMFDWTPDFVQSGLYEIEFFVTDGIFERSRTATITVLNVKKGKGRS